MKTKLVNYSLLYVLVILFGCNSQSQDKTVNKDSGVDSSKDTEVSSTPKNIILMIGDGMGVSQVTAGVIAKNNALQLEKFPVVGLVKTSALDDLVTDSAAGATAMSTGKKTYNGAIGVGGNKEPLETILEIAAKNGLRTGLVATSSITHATPASFFAHQPSRYLDEEIAYDMLNAPVDFFIGGGKDFFASRQDSLNLLDSLKNRGFKVYDGIADISSNTEDKIACFIAGKQPISVLEGRKDILPQASNKALNHLKGENGFFLMIEGSQIDWAGHSNESEGIVSEMIDFDAAIGEVLEFAKKDGNTLVIVTADHETGGYAIMGGDQKTAKIEGGFTTKNHTAAMVPLFAYGPGSNIFAGIYENTAIFDKMIQMLSDQKK